MGLGTVVHDQAEHVGAVVVATGSNRRRWAHAVDRLLGQGAQDPAEPVRLAVVGDSGIGDSDQYDVAAVIRSALEHVAPERCYPCTNCGMAPLARPVASAKLRSLAAGAALVRAELGG